MCGDVDKITPPQSDALIAQSTDKQWDVTSGPRVKVDTKLQLIPSHCETCEDASQGSKGK